jgi:hypothetical protein
VNVTDIDAAGLLALLAERDALKAENARLREQVARQSETIKRAMGAYQQGVRDAVQPPEERK